MHELYLGFAFIMGATAGTFLTTCIERLPFEDDDFFEEEAEPQEWYYRIPMFSLFIAMPLYTRFRNLLPSSTCPACGRRLSAGERMPILSFFLQQGRCRGCSYKIPGRHLFVEVFTGILFVVFADRFAPGLDLAVALLFVCLFMIATVVDFRYQIIPDEVNLFGLLSGLVLAVARSGYFLAVDFIQRGMPFRFDQRFADLLERDLLLKEGSLGWAITGFLAGAGALTILYYVGTAIAGTEAMGGGDVKLAGFIGMFMGAKGVLVALFWSTIIGAFFGLLILLFGFGTKEGGFTKFAFGPYICAGTLLTVYFTVDGMLDAYLGVNNYLMTLLIRQPDIPF